MITPDGISNQNELQITLKSLFCVTEVLSQNTKILGSRLDKLDETVNSLIVLGKKKQEIAEESQIYFFTKLNSEKEFYEFEEASESIHCNMKKFIKSLTTVGYKSLSKTVHSFLFNTVSYNLANKMYLTFENNDEDEINFSKTKLKKIFFEVIHEMPQFVNFEDEDIIAVFRNEFDLIYRHVLAWSSDYNVIYN